MSNRNHYILSFLCIFFGIAIYAIFREEVMFLSPFQRFLSFIPHITLQKSLFSDFLLYNLADLLWVLALMFYATTLQSDLLKKVALSIPIILEISQAFSIIPGTFDLIDLTIYILTTFIFYLLWKIKEKNSQCSAAL